MEVPANTNRRISHKEFWRLFLDVDPVLNNRITKISCGFKARFGSSPPYRALKPCNDHFVVDYSFIAILTTEE